MIDNIPKENPLWPKHHLDLVDEAWRKRLEQLSGGQRTKYLPGEWVSDELPSSPKTIGEDEDLSILTASVGGYLKCSDEFVSIPNDIKTSEDLINWVRSEDDRQT